MSDALAVAWRHAVGLAARRRSDIEFFVPTAEPVFALTLDDGPDPSLTPDVLRVLRAHGALATFFLIGSRAQAHPALVRRIRDEGHEVGNHMWRDEPARRLTNVEFERSLLRTEASLAPSGATRLLRPGSGFVDREKTRLAARHGYRCVLGSVHPFDAHLRSRRWISGVVRLLVRAGDIVILHEGGAARAGVVPALDEILADARRRGLRPVPAGALLARDDADHSHPAARARWAR